MSVKWLVWRCAVQAQVQAQVQRLVKRSIVENTVSCSWYVVEKSSRGDPVIPSTDVVSLSTSSSAAAIKQSFVV